MCVYIYIAFRIDPRHFCQRLSANLVDSFSRDFRGTREGWIGWLENRFCRRVVAILVPFQLIFLFSNRRKFHRGSHRRISNACSRHRRVNENGRVTRHCLPKNHGGIVNPPTSFLLRHCSSIARIEQRKHNVFRLLIVHIYIYNSLIIISSYFLKSFDYTSNCVI